MGLAHLRAVFSAIQGPTDRAISQTGVSGDLAETQTLLAESLNLDEFDLAARSAWKYKIVTYCDRGELIPAIASDLQNQAPYDDQKVLGVYLTCQGNPKNGNP